MADTPPSDKDLTDAQQDEALKLRRQFSNAYAAIMGTQTSKEFSAFTFEEALQQQLDRIQGESTKLRPNELERVDKIESELLSAVEQTKALPPESFREPEDDDVNKELDDDEQAEYDQYLADTIAEREQAGE
jgi:hypothetical protein